MSKSFYVYQLRVQGQKLPFYIGKGVGRRCNRHWEDRLLQAKSHKNHTIRKALRDGFDIYSEILADGLAESTALKLEVEWIAHYGRRIDGSGCLTNLTLGGDGVSGHSHTEEARRKMSEAHRRREMTPERRQKLSAWGKKSHSSPETRINISKSLMGHFTSEETKRKIGKANSLPTAIYQARLAWGNPLFSLTAHAVRPQWSRFQCRYCGNEFETKSTGMLRGMLPKDHYWCSVEAFALDRGTRVYQVRRGPQSSKLKMLRVPAPKDVEFTFSFRKKGVIFFDLDGNEISRARLPEDYMRARIRAERQFTQEV